MRKILLLLACAAANYPFIAQAAVSDDLVFCSKLTSPRERISCYDAAARIAANGKSKSIETTPSRPMATAPAGGAPTAEPYIAPMTLPFQGFYIAGGGSYGVVAPHQFGIGDQVSFLGGTAHPSGFSGVAAAGYNLQYGHLVTGIEFSGRFGREWFSQSQFDAVRNDSVVATSLKTYEFNTDSAVHLALRAGLAVENTLIYGKVGIGAAHTIQKAEDRLTGTQCVLFVFDPGSGRFVCGTTAPLVSPLPVSTAQWVPSLLLGAGIEQNLGSFFARIGAEAEAVRGSIQYTEFYWTIRATAMLGVRF